LPDGESAQQNFLIEYDYDLISGKVSEVRFQPNREDQSTHRYTYDRDNRLSAVHTSHDGVLWERDAEYEYYPHGPLRRISMGRDSVQGVDYTYTINGWLPTPRTKVRGYRSQNPWLSKPITLGVKTRERYRRQLRLRVKTR